MSHCDDYDSSSSSDGELVVVVGAATTTTTTTGRGGGGGSLSRGSRGGQRQRLLSTASSTSTSTARRQHDNTRVPTLSATGSALMDPYDVDDEAGGSSSNDDDDDDAASVLSDDDRSLRSRILLGVRFGGSGDDDNNNNNAPRRRRRLGSLLNSNGSKNDNENKNNNNNPHPHPPSHGAGRQNEQEASEPDVLVLSSDSENDDDGGGGGGARRDDDDDDQCSDLAGSKPAAARSSCPLSQSNLTGNQRNKSARLDESDSDSSSTSSSRSMPPRGRTSTSINDEEPPIRGRPKSSTSSSSSSSDDHDDESDDGSDASSDARRKITTGVGVGRRRPPRPPSGAAAAAVAAASRKRPLPTGQAAAAASASLSQSSSIDDYQAKKLQMLQDMERKRLGGGGKDKTKDSSRMTSTTATKRSGASTAKRATEEEREALRREKEERKRVANEFLQRQREKKKRDRIAKRAAKDAERADREQHVSMARQAAGRHAAQEIAVLMDPSLLRHDRNLYFQELEEQQYHVLRYESLLGCPAIQWIRRDFTKGGAEEAVNQLRAQNKDGYVHLPTLCVVFDDPNDFVRLLERRRDDVDDEFDDNFPALESWLRGVEAGWRQSWNRPASDRPRMVILLHRVPQRLVELRADFQARRNGVTKLPPSSEELNDAVAWLTIQFQVQCVLCSEHKYVNWEVTKMTRMLAESPYQRVYADFDCIAKLKRNCAEDAPLYEHATSIWMNQLQQLDGITFEKARNLARHYPTARSLWRAYQSDRLSHDEKAMLVSELFGDRRREIKASTQLHRLFTTSNPDEIL